MTLYCVLCRAEIPPERQARGAVTCSQACFQQKRKNRLEERKAKKCSACGRLAKGRKGVPAEALKLELAQGGTLADWLRARRRECLRLGRGKKSANGSNGAGTVFPTSENGDQTSPETPLLEGGQQPDNSHSVEKTCGNPVS